MLLFKLLYSKCKLIENITCIFWFSSLPAINLGPNGSDTVSRGMSQLAVTLGNFVFVYTSE